MAGRDGFYMMSGVSGRMAIATWVPLGGATEFRRIPASGPTACVWLTIA